MFDSEQEYLAAAVEEGEARAEREKVSPRANARKPKEPVKPSGVDPDAKVWVKCVTHNKPWTHDTHLEYWKDYEISLEHALIFEARKQAVILQAPNSKGSN